MIGDRVEVSAAAQQCTRLPFIALKRARRQVVALRGRKWDGIEFEVPPEEWLCEVQARDERARTLRRALEQRGRERWIATHVSRLVLLSSVEP